MVEWRFRITGPVAFLPRAGKDAGPVQCSFGRAPRSVLAMPNERFLAPLLPVVLLLAALVLAAPSAVAQEPTAKPEPWKLSVAAGPAFALGKTGARWAQPSDGSRRRADFHVCAGIAAHAPRRARA